LVLNDSSSISGNWVKPSPSTLFSFGGGVYNLGTLTLSDSATISGNAADQGGGIYAVSGSILNGVVYGPGGNVYDNMPDDCYVE
jgi:hypothetical protein